MKTISFAVFCDRGIMQESHSFNPTPARREDFLVTCGPDAAERARKTNSILGGIVDAADENGIDIQVPVMFQAQSGGPVEDAVFEEVRHRLVEAASAGGFDAIVLALHGGMLTTTLADPEGALFTSLREVAGNNIPITAAFDLHAHVTPETLTHCDFLTAFRTNPHSDEAETGRRACEAAIRIAKGEFEPVCASVHIPMLTLGADRTDRPGPLQDIHAYIAALLARGDAEDISIFNVQQFLDVPGVGQTVLAYTDGDPAAARTIADDVARRHWESREDLIGQYPRLEDQLARAGAGAGPLVLGDQGDRVAAGGPGDSTYILNILAKHFPELKAAVPITDAAAVADCFRAGHGAELTLTVGGHISTVAPPAEVTGIVKSLGDKLPYIVKGPHGAGQKAQSPTFAVLQSGSRTIVLTASPNAFIDPALYEVMGVDPTAMDVVVTRSGYHFSLNFAGVGECITVDTPGMTSYRIEELPFTVARPFYPLDKIGYQPVASLRRRAA